MYGVLKGYALSLCNKAILRLSEASIHHTYITSMVTNETPIVTKLFETLTGTHTIHTKHTRYTHMTHNERIIAHLLRKVDLMIQYEAVLNKALKFPNRINRYDV